MTRRSARWSQVTEGVFRLGVAEVNCYLVVAPDGMTLVDAGLPGTRPALDDVLRHLDARPDDIDALILTHGHFDHVGMARSLVTAHGTPTLVHPEDEHLAAHPYRYRHQASRIPYLLTKPRALPIVAGMAVHGALKVRGVHAAPRLRDGEAVDVPGRPVPLWTPGHTDGHCGFVFEQHGVLMSGDAIVTLEPYTGREGPRIVANAATADSAAALASLDAFLSFDARLMLPGHGDPWSGGVPAAVAEARAAGPS